MWRNARGKEVISAMNQPHTPVGLPEWQRFLADHADGAVMTGRVVDVKPFGVFVAVADGIHGLLHSSEYTTAPDDGATVSVRIREVDLANRRMSLTLA